MPKRAALIGFLAWCTALPSWAQGLDLSTQNGLLEDRTNAGTTGTTLYTLTKINGSGLAVIAATSDSNGVRGVCVGGCGTSGNAQIATNGTAALLLDGAGTVGDFVQISSTTGGYGHDTGATTCPSSGQTVGKIVASGGPSSSYYVALGAFGCGSGGATGFTNVYTGHGTYTWNKPSGISWVTAYCLGAGGGGASGAVSTSAYSGGGGGGASGSLSTIPASLVSSTVTVTVGQGGAGGSASTTSITMSVRMEPIPALAALSSDTAARARRAITAEPQSGHMALTPPQALSICSLTIGPGARQQCRRQWPVCRSIRRCERRQFWK